MLAWLLANLGTVVLCAALLAVVGAIVHSLHRRRKSGASACGCSCADCAMCGECRK